MKKTDALKNLVFKEAGSGGGSNVFVKLEADVPVKLRVLTTNPMIHLNQWGKEQYSFAVWSHDEKRPMVLSKGASVAKQISTLHQDEDFGEDITKLDIKILPTGEKLERQYAINVLPKPLDVTDEQLAEVEKLDSELDKIIRNGVRAEEYNEGARPAPPEQGGEEPIIDPFEGFDTHD